MALVNVMENIVEEKLHRMLEAEDCCKCDRCFEDMKAKALNQLPARYVRTHPVGFTVAVANAIDVISAHPSHENKNNNDDKG